MRNVNKVILLGRLTSDPQTHEFENGTNKSTFSIATNYKTKNGDDYVEYHDINAWGILSNFTKQYLKKGDAIYLEGRLHAQKWKDDEGKNRVKKEIIAGVINSIQLKQRVSMDEEKIQDLATANA